MIFRVMLPDQYMQIEAENESEAQNYAFAKTVRDLSPSHFQAWPVDANDEWKETA